MCKGSNKFILYLNANIATLHYEKLHSLTVKKLSFAINICSYLIGSLQIYLEQILTQKFSKHWCLFEAFPIYALDMLVALESRVLTYCSCF